jgi:flavin-binding protein dodecin
MDAIVKEALARVQEAVSNIPWNDLAEAKGQMAVRSTKANTISLKLSMP